MIYFECYADSLNHYKIATDSIEEVFDIISIYNLNITEIFKREFENDDVIFATNNDLNSHYYKAYYKKSDDTIVSIYANADTIQNAYKYIEQYLKDNNLKYTFDSIFIDKEILGIIK